MTPMQSRIFRVMPVTEWAGIFPFNIWAVSLPYRKYPTVPNTLKTDARMKIAP